MSTALWALATVTSAAEDLEKGFTHPPDSARPQTWWHWMNGNVTKQGITADLEAMKRIGLGGGQIFSVSCGIPTGLVKEVPYFSEEWRGLVQHAAEESSRLGLELSALNGDGWTGGGGPWITPDNTMQRVVWSQARVEGPGARQIELAQPPTKLEYYRDIAVVAFPTIAGGEDARNQPRITVNVAGAKTALLNDGDATKRVTIERPGSGEIDIQWEYPSPFVARSVALEGLSLGRDAPNRTELHVSDDGRNYRSVCAIALKWKGGLGSVSARFQAAKGRFFRLVFRKGDFGGDKLTLAEVRLSGEDRIHYWEAKAGFIYHAEHGGGAPMFAERMAAAPNNASASTAVEEADPPAILLERVIDLTAKMDASGRLEWDVPDGRWTILRIGYTPTGKTNHPATKAGHGLECDKLSPRGIEAQFGAMMAKLIGQLGPLAGKTFTQAVIDSWELGEQNWTAAFREEFRKRRGYDLLPWLPVMAGGRVVGDRDRSERFLWDVRRTIADLIAENFYGRMTQLCREHGIRFQGEPGGRQQYLYDPIVYQKQADVPMGEFWVGGGPRVDCRTAASAAHLYGKPIVAAESFTAGHGDWSHDPFSLKALGDRAFCLGINRHVFHRYAHQPWLNLKPGMTMGPYGINMERTNTWWEPSAGAVPVGAGGAPVGAAWIAYITRCQYLLQQGRFVADVLYLTGEGAPNYLGWNDELSLSLPPGYDYDGCDADAVLRLLSVKDGRLVTPGAMNYRMLLLPDSGAMTPAVARRVRDLVREGALVIGPRPAHSPSLAGYPRCDEEVREVAKEVWGDCDGQKVKEHAFGKGRVVWGKTFAEVAAEIGLAPDFEYKARGGDATVLFIHRRTGDADLYFVCNQEDRPIEALCAFRVAGKAPELWRADTGAISEAVVYEERDGRAFLPIRLDPAGSTFVVFRHSPTDSRITSIRKDGQVLVSASLEAIGRDAIATGKDAALLPIQDLYPDVMSNFTIAAWVLPSQSIRVYPEKTEGAQKTDGQRFLIDPEQGEFAYGAGHVGVGLSVGNNGVCVFEHSSRYRPVRLSVERRLNKWTHLALVYLNGAPRLYLDGRLARSGSACNYKVHPGGRQGKGAKAFAGQVEELRIDGRALSDADIAALAKEGARKQQTSSDQAPIELERAADGRLIATVSGNGRYALETAGGKSSAFSVDSIPAPLAISGAWELRFPAGWGAPEKVTLDKLISWTDHSNPGVRYFAGTATYIKDIEIPAALLDKGKVLAMDLGEVKNLAEVRLNGKDLGVLWKPPFRVDITEVAKPGKNQLEIRVTNLWPNRLIGDEQTPDDCKWTDRGRPDESRPIEKWPSWVMDDKPRPTAGGRYTFSTWKHYDAKSPLLESGLLGPVRIVPAERRTLATNAR